MKHGSLFKVGSNRYSIVVHLELNNAMCSILHVIFVGLSNRTWTWRPGEHWHLFGGTNLKIDWGRKSKMWRVVQRSERSALSTASEALFSARS